MSGRNRVAGLSAHGLHYWRDLVEMVELTRIERQAGDQAFAELLNRVRDGRQTEEDIAILDGRRLDKLGISPNHRDILKLPHVYPTNDAVSGSCFCLTFC